MKVSNEFAKQVVAEAERPFLNYLEERKKGEYVDLINLPDCYNGDFYSGEPVGGDKPYEIIINIDSRCLIKDFMSKDEKLTEEIQEAFDEGYETGGWSEWIEEWIVSKGGTIGRLGSDNTANEDTYYFWGSIYEWTSFEDLDGKEGVIIMWHGGGDYRTNYEYPEVWIGEWEDFYSSQYMGDPEEEIAYLLGYDGDVETMHRDIMSWIEGEEQTGPPYGGTPLPFGEASKKMGDDGSPYYDIAMKLKEALIDFYGLDDEGLLNLYDFDYLVDECGMSETEYDRYMENYELKDPAQLVELVMLQFPSNVRDEILEDFGLSMTGEASKKRGGRSIGKVNIRKLKEMIRQTIKDNGGATSETDWSKIEDEIIDEIPEEWFDMWEGAYQEIHSIIDETCDEEVHSKWGSSKKTAQENEQQLAEMIARRWALNPEVVSKVLLDIEGTTAEKFKRVREMGVDEFTNLCLQDKYHEASKKTAEKSEEEIEEIYYAEGWSDWDIGYDEAYDFISKGFSADEGVKWMEYGFSAADAKSWEDIGVTPEEAYEKELEETDEEEGEYT